ncbi:MAG: hypothetical protein ACTSVM_04585 [Candidatus Ranarchaeia archaeon]
MEIDYAELENWYNKKLDDISVDYRRQVEAFINRIRNNLDDLQSICTALEKAMEQDQEKASKAAAERLANKLNEIVSSEMQIPDKPFTFLKVESFFETINRFQRSVTEIGRRWIPRLSKSYKTIIQRMDGYFRVLSKNAVALYKFQEKFSWLKPAEGILEKIHSLRTEINKLPEEKSLIRIAQDEVSRLEKEIKIRENNIQQFRAQNSVMEYIETEQKIENLHQQSEALFDLLRKPFSKLLDALDAGKAKLSPDKIKVIRELLEDPIHYLASSSTDTGEIKKALVGFKESLQKDVIDYKKSKVRRTIRRIESLVKTNELDSLRSRAKLHFNAMGRLEDQVSFSKEERLYQEINELQKELSYSKERVQKYSDALDRQLNRINFIKATIENEVKNVLQEKIQIRAIPNQ